MNHYADISQAGKTPLLLTWWREARARLDFALPLSHLGEIRIGVATSYIDETPTQDVVVITAAERFVPVSMPSSSWTQSYARAQVVIDQLDDALFPRSGYLLRADAQSSFNSGDDAYQYLHASATVAASVDRHSVNATLEAGASKYSGYSGAPFVLGGFRHLAAYGVN
ncbi:serine protease [Candidatus Burkholderia brachyanthoides]|nr:serine protease [Candidatus Burkholderia brachyanthoides]